MASRAEYDMLFNLNAQLGGSYTGTFNNAQRQLIAMQRELAALSRQQSDIAAFQRQQSAVEATQRKLETLSRQYENIQREINETGTFSSTLANRMLSTQQQIDRTSSSLATQTQRLEQMRGALSEAGIDTNDLTRASIELASRQRDLTNAQREATERATGFGAASVQAFQAIQQAIVAAGVAKALKEIYEFYAECAGAAMEFESALAGVSKTTDLTNQELAVMSRELKDMSTEIPLTTTELATIAETAGQLGVAKDELLDFTEIMAMLGTATNMTADEAATMLAQFTSITGMNPALYSNLGSTIVELGNNYATTERNIADMSQTIAAAGAIAGMSEADIVAISAAVTSLGISAQNGGTQMTKLISDINSAVSSGEGLEDWASAAKMSADEFAAAWGDNAAGALDMFIRGLNETYQSGQDVYGVLHDLGISETRMVTMITSLAKSGDRLTGTLNTAGAAWSANSALTAEAEKRYSSTESQLVLMQNAYNNLKVAIGDNYTPALKELYAIGTDVLKGVTDFIEKNPELVKAVTVFTGVLFGVTGALTAYTVVVKVAAAVTAMFEATTAVALGPILAVTAGVAALAALFVYLAETTKSADEEARHLTETSREQYYQIKELNAEYDEAVTLYGESSKEAKHLKYEIEDLSREYERSKQTVEEFKQSVEASASANADLIKSYHDAEEQIDRQEYNVSALVGKLRELTAEGDLAAESQTKIKATVDALNEALPELNLKYEDVINGQGDFLDKIMGRAKVEADTQRFNESYAAYKKFLVEEPKLEDDAKKALEEKESAQRRLNEELDVYNAKVESMRGSSNSVIKGAREGPELQALRENLKKYEESYEIAKTALDESVAAQEEALKVMKEYAGVTGDVTEGNEALQIALAATKSELDALAEAYNKAYESALASVSGQYDLWDQAAKVSAISADTINKGMESQIKYWQDYNTNIAKLTDRSSDIEGLGEMLSTFADGSKDSVNAIAGMAAASDKDLKVIVKHWRDLQKEQETISKSLASLETEFTDSLNRMKEELEAAVEGMNLGSKAAESGRNTVAGFIQGTGQMLPLVRTAYKEIANAAKGAIDESLMMTNNKRAWRPEMTWAGYINRVNDLTPTSAMNSTGAAVSAERGSIGGSAFNITVAPQYHTTGAGNPEQLQSVFNTNNDNLRALVGDVLKDQNIDSARRAYR